MITDPIGYRLFKDIFHRKNLYQKMFVEYKARHHGINASKDLYYVNILNPFYIDRYKKVSPGFSSDISDHIEMSYTVIYHAMQIAAYMGFSKIYLIGVDHSYSYTINVNGETVKKIYKITQKR